LKRPDLRSFFRAQTLHADFNRRTQAVTALAKLPVDPEDIELFRKLVSDTQPYSVVNAALTALATLDPVDSRKLIMDAANTPSYRETIRSTAYGLLASAKAPEIVDILISAASTVNPLDMRIRAVETMGKLDTNEERTRAALGKALHDEYPSVVLAAVHAFGARKDTSALTELRLLQSKPPADAPDWLKSSIDAQIKELEKLK
jgi:HEAT repeat protein